MSDNTTQFIGRVICDRELAEDLFVGRIEYAEEQERSCVIQFLPGDVDEMIRRRFAQEAMIGFDVSRDHQNLVSTLHFGSWQDGRLFIAVDFVQGVAISEMMGQLHGDYDTIRAIADAALRALLFMHGRGIVHGAVQAENILMGHDRIVRLGNFQHARRIDDREESVEDLRALGALLFFMLSGTPVTEATEEDIQEHLPLDTPPDLVMAIVHLFTGSSEAFIESERTGQMDSWLALSALLGEREPKDPEFAAPDIGLESFASLGAMGTSIDADGFTDDDVERIVGSLADQVSSTIQGFLRREWRWTVSAMLVISAATLMIAFSTLWQERSIHISTTPGYEPGASQGAPDDDTQGVNHPFLGKRVDISFVGTPLLSHDRYSIELLVGNNNDDSFELGKTIVQIGEHEVGALVYWSRSTDGCTGDGVLPATTSCQANVEIPYLSSFHDQVVSIEFFDKDGTKSIQIAGVKLP